MKLRQLLLLSSLALIAKCSPALQLLALNPPMPPTTAISRPETVEEAAMIARSLVDNDLSIGNMATVFPEDKSDLANYPFSMQEYYASCHTNGSLTLLFLPISRHSKNIAYAAPHAASISVTSAIPAASRPRVSLLGNVTVFKDIRTVPELETIKACYLEKHPDAKWWLPDDDGAAHIAYWARFDPHAVYFVGGFGGLHYIGYIPLEEYQKAQPTLDFKGPTQEDQMVISKEFGW